MKDLENQEAGDGSISEGRTAWTGHTPGPWKVEPLAGKYYGTEVTDADCCRVCSLWNHHERELAPGEPRVSVREEKKNREPSMSDAEWEEFLNDYLCDSHHERQSDYANARLIAAAPDMLAALQVILGIYSDDESPNKGMRFSDRINLVRAAIAKATVIQDFDRVDGAKLERPASASKTGGAE